MRLRRGRFARGGRFVFRPRLGGRLELSGVFGGSPSFRLQRRNAVQQRQDQRVFLLRGQARDGAEAWRG